MGDVTAPGPGPTACSRCAAIPPAGARFCPNCAQPIDPPGSRSSTLQTDGSARRPGSKTLLLAALVAVAAVLAVVVFLAFGFHKASNKLNDQITPRPGRPSGYRGPAYAGMIVQDRVARGPGGSIDLNGLHVAATALVSQPGLFGARTVCSTVTIVNNSPTTASFGPQDWRLQEPDSSIASPTLTSTLQLGQLAPGGRTSGSVCFTEAGTAGRAALGGTRALLWQPLFQVSRGVWLLAG